MLAFKKKQKPLFSRTHPLTIMNYRCANLVINNQKKIICIKLFFTYINSY
jgi:hypothetical protein